jgi:transcriptional regulator with XRE-family HTH domain
MKPDAVSRIPHEGPSAAQQRRLIQRAREAKGLSQRALGAHLGVAQSVISRIENGQAAVAPALLLPLAAVLDIEGEALHALLAASGPDHWRGWVWSSPRRPAEKVLLLAVIDSPDHCIDLELLRVRTCLSLDRLRRLIDQLHREGLLRGVSGATAADARVTLAWVTPHRDPQV